MAGRKRRKAPPSAPVELTITGIGRHGDGLATHGGKTVYVPFTGPDDQVLARLGPPRAGGVAATVLQWLRVGSPRNEPFCPAFGRCGGCSLQHLPDETQADLKRGWIVEALAKRGLSSEIRAVQTVPRAARRRVALKAGRFSDGLALGLNEAFGNIIVDLERCPLLVDSLNRLFVPLRRVLATVLPARARADITLTATESGVDVVLGLEREPDLAAREALAAFAERPELARLWWRPLNGRNDPEPLALRRPWTRRIGAWPVQPPPAPFMQAAAETEAWITRLSEDVLPTSGRVADLFCGWGGLALALLGQEEREVLAVDSDEAAMTALDRAIRDHDLGRRLTTQHRDLFRDPLGRAELDGLDAVVLDPPRAGARAQAEALAGSSVPVILAVSCNPASFARDARILVDGGYALRWIQPMDQFRHSAHVELAGLFRRM